MKALRFPTALLWATALLALAGSLYCAMWVLSSASLASGACGPRFSLFADTWRCRQPDIAMMLSVACFGAFLLLAIRARRRERSRLA